MLSACRFAVCKVCSGACCSRQPSSPCCGKVNCTKGICLFFFLSDVSHNKNENWVGIRCCDHVFFLLPFVYEYLRKKVGLFSRLLLPVMGLDSGLQLPERTGYPLCLLRIFGAQPVYSCYDN